MNKEGAISGMIVGLVFCFSYIVFFKFVAPELTALSIGGLASLQRVLAHWAQYLISL